MCFSRFDSPNDCIAGKRLTPPAKKNIITALYPLFLSLEMTELIADP